MGRVGRRPSELNRELSQELREKKRVYDLGKKKQTTQEEHKDVVRSCRKIGKVKSPLELNLATFVKDNKKWFYKYIGKNRRAK